MSNEELQELRNLRELLQTFLYVKIHTQLYRVDSEVLEQVFSIAGTIVDIIPANDQFRIRFQHPDSALEAFIRFNERNIYNGCCRLELFLDDRINIITSEIEALIEDLDAAAVQIEPVQFANPNMTAQFEPAANPLARVVANETVEPLFSATNSAVVRDGSPSPRQNQPLSAVVAPVPTFSGHTAVTHGDPSGCSAIHPQAPAGLPPPTQIGGHPDLVGFENAMMEEAAIVNEPPTHDEILMTKLVDMEETSYLDARQLFDELPSSKTDFRASSNLGFNSATVQVSFTQPQENPKIAVWDRNIRGKPPEGSNEWLILENGMYNSPPLDFHVLNAFDLSEKMSFKMEPSREGELLQVRIHQLGMELSGWCLTMGFMANYLLAGMSTGSYMGGNLLVFDPGGIGKQLKWRLNFFSNRGVMGHTYVRRNKKIIANEWSLCTQVKFQFWVVRNSGVGLEVPNRRKLVGACVKACQPLDQVGESFPDFRLGTSRF